MRKKVFVHKDFHISNMMIKKKKIYLIDNQDAVIGNPAYDLASLVDDVRINTTLEEKKKILEKFISNKKKIKKKNFLNDFEILSILRNFKILGIFTRLSIRDKKNKYLRMIPRAWRLIDNRLNNKKFDNLRGLINKHFNNLSSIK